MNILNTIRDQITPEVLGQISRSVGESPEASKLALDHSIPALLGSAAATAASPEGASNLFEMLKSKMPASGWPSSISSLLGSLTGSGGGFTSSLVTSLLGPKAGMLRDFIASRTGVRSDSASNLLGMAGNLLTGVLGRHVASQGLGASGFADMLRSQIPNLQGFLPTELASKLGLGNLLSLGKAAIPSIEAAQTPATYEPVAAAASAASPGLGKALRWALVPLALLLGAIFLMNRSGNTGGTRDDSSRMTGMGSAISSNLPIDSANYLEGFKTAIANGDTKPIDLRGVEFDSSGHLTPTSSYTVALLGSLLSKSSSTRVTITAFGDSVEEAGSRANALKSGLVRAGVPTERIVTQPEVGSALPQVSFTK